MFVLNASGTIGRIIEIPADSGKLRVKMRIACNVDVKNRQYQWEKTTFWVQVEAWEDIAQSWLNRYKVGDSVEVCGRPNFVVYTNDEGQTSKTIEVYGIEGGTPTVRWTPGRGNSDESNAAPPPATSRYRGNPRPAANDDLGL